MYHLEYQNGQLHCEDVALQDIASVISTPFYCYSSATLRHQFSLFKNAFEDLDVLVCFAAKANSNIAVLRTLGQLGAGADIVSGGELQRALDAGIPAHKLVFSGVAKTDEEIANALEAGVMQFNVESDAELDAISVIASQLGNTANVAIRINPDVAANTHAKISTGKRGDKFGIDWDYVPEIYARAATLPGVRVQGIAVHIGSQITDLVPFEKAFLRVGEMLKILRGAGHNIQNVDLGGGLGVSYIEGAEPPSPTDYATVVRGITKNWGVRLMLEPGRLIVGNAGVLVTKVRFIKQAGDKTYAVVDSAMNDLIRPSLYDGYHHVLSVTEPRANTRDKIYDIVGPICESGDILAKQRTLPELKQDDLMILMTAGAYGAAMSSTYNSRPLIPEVMVRAHEWAVIRRRQTYKDMVSLECQPFWQG